MYYLMQPYNLQSEIVDSKYKLVYFLTYLVVFYTFDMKLPTLYYGLFVILFTVIYILVSLYLVYKYADKTFKIK